MANPYIFATVIDPQSPDDFTITTTGGTLDGASAVVQVTYDDASFTDAEGKVRLILALKHLANVLEEPSFTWPIS